MHLITVVGGYATHLIGLVDIDPPSMTLIRDAELLDGDHEDPDGEHGRQNSIAWRDEHVKCTCGINATVSVKQSD